MAWNTEAGLNALATLVQGLTGMQGTVYKGVPESLATGIAAYVAIGDMEPLDKTTGVVIQLQQDYLVVFGYRVAGNEAGAEVRVAQFKDRFTRALYDDRTLGGVVDDAKIVPGLATTPQYLAFAGAETRLYPIQVRTKQRETITP